MLSTLTSAGRARYGASARTAMGGLAEATRAQVIEEDYAAATARHHTVLPLLHTVFGAVDAGATDLLDKWHKKLKGRLPDPANAPWTARSYRTLHAQLLSTAVQRGVAKQIEHASANSEDADDWRAN